LLDKGPNTAHVGGKQWQLTISYVVPCYCYWEHVEEHFGNTKIQKNENHLEINFWVITANKPKFDLAPNVELNVIIKVGHVKLSLENQGILTFENIP
jgi:hypothetical protein